MAYLAKAGFDVFSMDMTGYGRSTRPPAMNDPCNFSKEQQAQFVPKLIPAPCAPSHPTPITTMGSDWNDIGAVVDHLRALRRVDKVSLVGWSQGGPRAGGYAARNPEKVARLVVLAPAYNRTAPLDAPNPLPAGNGPMTAQSQADFTPTGIARSAAPNNTNRRERVGLVGHARVRSRRRDLGHGRPPRAAGADLGFQSGGRREDADALPDGGGRTRQAGRARARARTLRRPGLEAESLHRPRVLVAQRHVGKEPPAAVPGLARMAEGRQGERNVRRRIEARLLD